MTLRQIIDAAIKQRLSENNGNIIRTAESLGVSMRMVRYTVRRFEREQAEKTSQENQKILGP